MTPASETLFLEGAVSLRAVLSAGSREVFEVYYRKSKSTSFHRAPGEKEVLLELARSRGIAVTEVGEDFFAAHAEGNTHGGLMARVGEKKLVSPQELVSENPRFLAYLCGMEDPYNFASCLRTLYAAGCEGVFLPARNWLSAAGVLVRASAGASEYLPMAYAPENAVFPEFLEAHGINPVSAREERAQNLYETTFPSRVCLVLGGEKRGTDRALEEKIERGVIIPYGRTYHRSLSSQAACAVIAFEIMRQQKDLNR